jgi:hypothetical protein
MYLNVKEGRKENEGRKEKEGRISKNSLHFFPVYNLQHHFFSLLFIINIVLFSFIYL